MQKSSDDIDLDAGVEPAAGRDDKVSGAKEGEAPEKDMAQEQEPRLEKMTREQLIQKLEAAKEEAERNFETYLRVAAELENIKKRHLRDREDTRKFSNEGLIKNLLAVVDSLEQALVHSEGDSDTVACVTEGVQLTLRGLMDVLGKEGLTRVKSVGEPFDPNFHEAVSEMPDESAEPGTIIHELQSGYLLNGRLIRPAKVVVSRKPS
ncbi:MAG: nucleotide exchange factor GrpE [Desulfatiglandaceae bacterium]